MAKRVLSIDGGGIRGIIPALILAEIEERTHHSISDLFDLIAGTSTGGILALGLTTPDDNGRPKFTAKRLVELYELEGSKIFSRSVWHRVRAMGNLTEEKYPSDGIDTVLMEYFKQTRLKSVIKPVLVTGYEIENRIPWFFKSRHANNPERTAAYDFPIFEVARATSAAPTYFEPAVVENNEGEKFHIVDGGVFANNPAMCAYVEAMTMSG